MSTTPEQPEQPNKRVRLTPRGIATIAVLVALLLLGGTGVFVVMERQDTTPTTGADTDAPVAAEDEVVAADEETAADPFSDPGAFVGQTVTLAGEATDATDPFVFILENAEGATLAVVHRGLPKIDTNMVVEVTGTITEFDEAKIEEVLGSDLSSYHYERDDAYAIVASNIQKLSTGTVVATTDPEKAGGATPTKVANDAATLASTVSATVVSSSSPNRTLRNDDRSSGSTTRSRAQNGTSNGSTGGGGKDPAAATKIAYTGAEWTQYTDAARFKARLKRNGEPIRGARVVFELRRNGESWVYRARTDRNGVAISTKKINRFPGTYRVIVRYGVGRGERVRDKAIYEVEREDTSLDLEVQSNTDGSERDVLIATLAEHDTSRPLGGRSVNFYAGGDFIGSATTGSDGVARLEVPSDYSGDSFAAHFATDDYYITSYDET